MSPRTERSGGMLEFCGFCATTSCASWVLCNDKLLCSLGTGLQIAACLRQFNGKSAAADSASRLCCD